MAHKTFIGGTTYEIKGGRTLVNGTGYDIKGGKTLVGGTGYDVGFGEPVTLNIFELQHYPIGDRAYVMIDGIKYTGTQLGLQLVVGQVVQIGISAQAAVSSIKIGGETVAQATSAASATYDWIIPEGIKSASIILHGMAGYFSTVYVDYCADTKATVSVTGSGHNSYAYVIINGTKYTGAVNNLVVQHGDVITVRTKTDDLYTGLFYDVTKSIWLSSNDEADRIYDTTWYVHSVSTINFDLTYWTEDGRSGTVNMTTS